MPTNEDPQPGGIADSYAHTERIGFGLLMIGAPILMVLAGILHPPHGIENATEYYDAAHDHSTRFWVSHTFFFLSAVLFVPAVVGLARLVHPSRPRAAFWGCVLSLMGFVGYGALDGVDYMAYVAGKPDTGLDPTTMQQFIDAALNSMAIIVPMLVVFSLLPAGLAVLAVGLTRAGVLPGWIAWLMPIGMAGVAAFLEFPIPLIISGVLLLISFGLVGVRLLRTPRVGLTSPGPV